LTLRQTRYGSQDGNFRPFRKEDFRGANTSVSKFEEKYNNCSFENFLKIASEYDFVTWVSFFDDLNLDKLSEYLQNNFTKYQQGSYSSPFRKIIVFYDWLKYGQSLSFDI